MAIEKLRKRIAGNRIYATVAEKDRNLDNIVMAEKADKVGTGHGNNVASFDSAGNLKDSGVAASSLTSKNAAEGGTAISLVTTGEKFNWNTIRAVPASTSDDEDKVLAVDDQGATVWKAFDSDVFGTQLIGEHDQPILDEESTPSNPIYVYDANSTDELLTGFAGKGFGAIRAYADQDGHNIKATYVKKAELNEPDEAPESDIDNMFIIPNTVVIGDRRYRTVTIGNQEWLAENLDYKFECNGATIPVGGSMESTEPRAWYYNNDEATYGVDGTYKCGLLYNWYATKYLDDHKSTLLADGWRVPYYADWDALCRAIGYPTDANSRTTGGTYLKACDNSVTNNWPDGWNGIDEHGLSIIPAGYCDGTDSSPFGRFGSDVNYWTSDCDWDEETIDKSGTYMHFKQTEIAGRETSGVFNAGYSIRLVRTIS